MLIARSGNIWWADAAHQWEYKLEADGVVFEGQLQRRFNTGIARLRRDIQNQQPVVIPTTGWEPVPGALGWRLR